MKKTTIFLFFSIILCSCTSTKQAIDVLNTTMVGKNIDEFVLQYGTPSNKHQMNNGEYIYTWNSGVLSYAMPSTTTMSGTSNSYGYQGTATITGGGSIKVFCEIQIHTDSQGNIINFKAMRDTLGKWTTSRCSEIFK